MALQGTNELMIFLGHQDFMKYCNWCNGYPFMSKDPCRPHTGNTQWSMWVCLLTLDCLPHYSFHNMAYKKMFNLVKWGVELKMNWLNWSIPISSGFQFNSNSNSKSFNSFELNWLSIPIQFMNWSEPWWQDKMSFCLLIRFNWRVPARVPLFSLGL